MLNDYRTIGNNTYQCTSTNCRYISRSLKLFHIRVVVLKYSKGKDEAYKALAIRLPRTDGGKAAWLFLAAGFVIEALVWGLFWSSPCNP
jgi:hypothetical protein